MGFAHNHQNTSDKDIYRSSWRDLNSRPLDPQTSAACPRTSTDVQFSLKIRILYLGVFRWTNPNGGQNGGQTHSQTKQRGLLSSRLCIAMVVLMPSTIARGGRPRSGAVGTTESASEESPSEEPSVDCRRVPDDEACRRTAQPDHSFGDLSGAERRLDPLEPEPAEPHLEGSERSARAESGMSGCSGCDRGLHHGTHGQGSWQIVDAGGAPRRV
jgi:hypothetical protein